MSVIAVLTFIALLYLCGLGPTLLLIPPKESPRRVLIIPALGLCVHILFSIFLAQFSLTGNQISLAALPFFTLLGVWGWRKSPLSRAEVTVAAPAILMGFFSVAVFGWPLFYSGIQNYWGFANPDQGFLTPVMEWIQRNPLGVPPEYADRFRDLGSFRDIPQNTLLAVFYVSSTLSLITSIPIGLLFNVTALCMAYIIPGSVYALADVLGLRRQACLTASALASCSALVAYTFYLDSLAAMTVIAITPAATALLLRFVKKPGLASGAPVSIIAAGMYYNYLGVIGLLGLLIGIALIHSLFARSITLRQLILFSCVTAILITLAFAPLALTILRFFFEETFGSRFEAVDELLMFPALTLTELGVPFFWGLWIPGGGGWPFVDYPLVAFVLGALFFLIFILSWHRISGLPGIYRWMVAGALGVIVLYAYRRIGYGVFKLIPWVHPLILVAFVAAVFGLSHWLRASNRRVLAGVVFSVLPIYAGTNLMLALRMGKTALGGATILPIHNAPELSVSDVRDLREVGRKWGREGIIATLPDPVVTGWAGAYLLPARFEFFPTVLLKVYDSVPQFKAAEIPGRFLLHWNRRELDIVPLPECRNVWANQSFAVSSLNDECRNVMVVGQGWYRCERRDWEASRTVKPFRWLRKRGELLLINPDPAPKRLLMHMRTGPGNRAPRRTVSILLNGARIDQFVLSGEARILTSSFTAPGAVSQFEILVDEDADPLPRRYALWNLWVPRDPRRLNIGISDASLVPADWGRDVLRSSIDLASGGGSGALTNGVYGDRWMGSEATVTLHSPVRVQGLLVEGTVPDGAGLRFPFHMEARLNNFCLPTFAIQRPGRFQARYSVADSQGAQLSGQTVRVQLQTGGTFAPRNADQRRLSVRIDRISLIPKS